MLVVHGHNYLKKIEKFINEMYEEDDNYSKFLKRSSKGKVGEIWMY